MFVHQSNEVKVGHGTQTPCPCPFRCAKPVPATMHVRFHPFRDDAEVRRCPNCKRESIFPLGEKFYGS